MLSTVCAKAASHLAFRLLFAESGKETLCLHFTVISFLKRP